MSGAGAANAAPGGAGAVESMSRQELVATVVKQTEQLRRYETRLRDVVTAYKGLVKQKEALETSLNALNKSQEKSADDDSVAALTLSLSTLTAEKSRMEEAFQADKRMTREKYEKTIQDLREEFKSQQHQSELNNLKAKLAYEMQEREKERADHAAAIKELHMKLNSERKTKEKLEDKFAISTDTQVASTELEKRVRDLSGELEAAQRRLARAEARTGETPQLLLRLQEKMALLQQGHAAAIRQEQIKARMTEEAARKLCASQEERVAALEGRLAELSGTVGEYDRRRRSDQLLIQQLRESLNRQILEQAAGDVGRRNLSDETGKSSETDNEKLADTEYLQNLIDKIHILKRELTAENSRLGNPVDVSSLFRSQLNEETLHAHCREELDGVRAELEVCRRRAARGEAGGACGAGAADEGGARREAERLLARAAELQERVDCLEEQLRYACAEKEELLRQAEENLVREQTYHKDVCADLRSRILQLEKQLSSQRERYSLLLEETDNYIRSTNARSRRVSAEEGLSKDAVSLQEESAPPHMLHYAHELARRDLDITTLRRDKHALEGQLRDIQRDATIEKERLKEVLRNLKEEIDRLRRIQSREGANLEYLKNVVLSYLVSSDLAGRRHKLNAIAAVLHFTDGEKNSALAVL